MKYITLFAVASLFSGVALGLGVYKAITTMNAFWFAMSGVWLAVTALSVSLAAVVARTEAESRN